MKILRISNSKGEFSLDGINYSSVDTINKDDLLNMIDVFVNSECEMDEYSKKMWISFGIAVGVILFIAILIIPWGI